MKNSCPVCKGTLGTPIDSGVLDFEYDAPGRYDYSPCLQCGALTISPLPDGDILAAAYPPYYHAYKAYGSPVAAHLKRCYWRRLAKSIVNRVGTRARVLDVGCACGDLLTALRELGVSELLGVEYSSTAAGLTERKGFLVIHGELEDVTDAYGPFDVITMVNIIEHVVDPVATMRHAANLMAEGGFVIGETPNYESWDKTLSGRFWGGYHTPRHIMIFNERSLHALGRQADLRLIDVQNIVQPAHWALSLQNWMRNKGVGLKIKEGRSPLFPWLLLAAAPLNVFQSMVSKTSSMAFVYEKTTWGSGE